MLASGDGCGGGSGCSRNTRMKHGTLIRELHWRGLLSESLRNMLEGAFKHFAVAGVGHHDSAFGDESDSDRRLAQGRDRKRDSADGHSRYPVIDDDRGVVEGILLAKDVLTRVGALEDQDFSIKDMMLPPHTLPESKRLSSLLRGLSA